MDFGTCSGSYTYKATGKTKWYGLVKYWEYTCCKTHPWINPAWKPKANYVNKLWKCRQGSSCISPNVKGGFDCWANMLVADPALCSFGKVYKLTGKTAWYGILQYYEYTCCGPEINLKWKPKQSQVDMSWKCSQSRCLSSNGKGGHDCWANVLTGDLATCTFGSIHKYTWKTAWSAFVQYYEYTCCGPNRPAGVPNKRFYMKSGGFEFEGFEPTGAVKNAPVFIWIDGTNCNWNDAADLNIVREMAKKGYTSATLRQPYDNGLPAYPYLCTTFIARAKRVAAAINVLCTRGSADCTRGVALGGFSQGAQLINIVAGMPGLKYPPTAIFTIGNSVTAYVYGTSNNRWRFIVCA